MPERNSSSVTSGTASPNDVRSALTFIVPQDTKPYFESSALTGGLPKVYFDTEAREVNVQDMRQIADQLSLDRQGFLLVPHETTVDDLYDDAALAAVYNRELEVLLKRVTGADRVAVFDHTRRSDQAEGAANPDGARAPADRVHVDYTVASGPKRAADVLGRDEVDRILAAGGRIMQINVWRPIRGPVRRSPLALADADSVRPSDLIATDQRFPDRVGEIYQLAHGEGQRWYWVPEMERGEVLLIKGWDSLDNGCARFTPHGAFQLASQDPGAPARESIEVRTYVILEG